MPAADSADDIGTLIRENPFQAMGPVVFRAGRNARRGCNQPSGDFMKTSLALTAFCVLMCAGCATTHYRPIVDSGVSRGSYEEDVADCQHLADQRPAAAQAAGGAVAGALIGALLGAAVGLHGDDVAEIAAWGAVEGGAIGADDGTHEQRMIVSRCMEGRGYAVIAD
jgi:uncharacterized protein YcfJ